MRFGRVDEKGADIGFLDGGEGAKSGKLFDADFAPSGLAEAGGVKDFEGAAVETDFDAIDVAGRALARADEGLLFLTKSVEEAGFADVRATDESDF